jgi:hypothetical protein
MRLFADASVHSNCTLCVSVSRGRHSTASTMLFDGLDFPLGGFQKQSRNLLKISTNSDRSRSGSLDEFSSTLAMK